MTKLFAVIENDIVIDGWIADSFEEAQNDNPLKTIVEMTIENSPAYIGQTWKGIN